MPNKNTQNNHPDDEMMRKILRRECGSDCDEFAADELEALSHGRKHRKDDGESEIGESDYFSTCEYTMIPTDDDTFNCQGS